jgi:hypothetical protein
MMEMVHSAAFRSMPARIVGKNGTACLRQRVYVAAAVLALPLSSAAAAGRARPLFEPTDLEVENPGTVAIDLQVGFVQGRGPARLVIPDLELDIGVLRNVELDLDAGYAIEGPEAGRFALDHSAPDSLWTAAKIGLLSLDGDAAGIGLGLQLGPKIPLASGSRGPGVEALALIGLRHGRTHLVLDLGGFVDPAPGPGTPRPRGLEAGIDLDVDLDRAGRWSITGELGGVRFSSDDPHQLTATVGLAWAPSDRLELSVVTLAGLLHGGDRHGLLLGASAKLGR